MTTAWAIVTANFLDSECWTGYAWTNYYWILEGPRMAIIAVIYISHIHMTIDNYYLYQSYVWLYHINIYVDVTGYSWQLRQCKILTVKTCGQINHGQLLFFSCLLHFIWLKSEWMLKQIINGVNRQTLFFFSIFYVFCWRSWETATRVKPSKSGK